MSALSEALVAAQRRAVTVLGKQYVAGTLKPSDARSFLADIGLGDEVDANRWLASLAIIRAGGGEAPSETEPKPEPAVEKMSDKQRGFIEQLAREKNLPLPEDFDGMTKAQAHDAINALQDGSYDPAKYRVPF